MTWCTPLALDAPEPFEQDFGMLRFSRLHGNMLASAAALLLASCDYSGRAPSDTTGAVSATAGATTSAGATTTAAAPADSGLVASQPGDSGVPVPTDTVLRQAADSQARPTVPSARVHLEVDIAARQLHVFRDSVLVQSHPISVGSSEWPTRTGQWNIKQVVWNPEWIPPDETWAEQRKPRKPGDPENPLGRAQLVYDPPRSIHGTNDPKSIGKAVSHGSIRVTNKVAQELAQMLMEETGVGRDSSWYQAAKAKRTVKQIVDLPQFVPIRVY
jgi:lipoprotein-anchoring transpeptidase ErfK/SrfK